MLRMSLRSPLRPFLRPVATRTLATHERGAAPIVSAGTTANARGAAAKFLQRPLVWVTAALAGGGTACVLGHDAITQVRRSRSPTRVEIGHGLSDGDVRRRLAAFVESLATVEAVELHWWSPTTARVVGQYLEGDIRVREGWLDVTMRVHGPLRVRSQHLHSWMVENLRRVMDIHS